MLASMFIKLLKEDTNNFDSIDTSHYGKIVVANSITQLMVIMQLVSSFEILSFLGWRGQSNIDWKIDSSAARRLKAHVDNELLLQSNASYNLALINYEKELINSARQRGYGYFNNRILSDLEILSIVQHFGGATRLLDFSKNAFIALWFACQDNLNEYGLLTCLNIGLHSNDVIRFSELNNINYEALITGIDEKLCIYEPYQLIPRLKSQQGFFVLSKLMDNSFGSIVTSSEEDFLFIALSPSLKQSLNSLWGPLFGLNERFIYDDIEGFSKANSIQKPFDSIFAPLRFNI